METGVYGYTAYANILHGSATRDNIVQGFTA